MSKTTTKIKDIKWKTEKQTETDILETFEVDGRRITVLNRQTGWSDGMRDVETGYKNKNSKNKLNFWLASGNFDIREYPDLTVEEAIKKIKDNANTCIGEEEL